MRTPEGDDLLAVIRQLVHGHVHPAQEEAVVGIVAQTVIIIMSDPKYYTHLKLVIEMQSRIIQLERVLALYQQQMSSPPVRARAAPKPRKATAKKAPAKPTVKKVTKKPAMPYNVKQFRRGAKGL
jgi:hypothetical protein